eukprot:GEZU01017149.1.p1 GENE.GEZU01017149.1~~GEZU01017149.1.p1  ORF type:complete len:274 (+),score=39.88 GEZU01017149.1:31-852(+)
MRNTNVVASIRSVAALMGFLLLVTTTTVVADITSCPSSSPCIGCNPNCDPYYCITIPKGNYYASVEERAQLLEYGLDSVTTKESTLSYRIVFHNNTVNYPTTAVTKICQEYSCKWVYCPCVKWTIENASLATNMNKLFGFTRGYVPVMDRSCMFAWRRTLGASHAEPEGKLIVDAYGWRDAKEKPWETPGQMPYMATLDPEHEYLFEIFKLETSCNYIIADGETGEVIATASTSHLPGGVDEGFKFALYFGGDVAATQDVTVSYSKNVGVCDA